MANIYGNSPQDILLALRKKYSDNLHPNFINLSPEHQSKRTARIAEIYKRDLRNNLGSQTRQIAHNKFKSFVNKGGSLDLRKLGKLNSTWKRDYAAAKFKEGK